jgi:hypothetical protein
VLSHKFLRQKLEYIHDNPLRCVDLHLRSRDDYELSSARYYDLGLPAVIPLDDVQDWL